MVEFQKRLPLSELRKLRTEFGPGNAGKAAFRTIAGGAACEGRGEDGSNCSNQATETVDIDAPRINVLVQLATCRSCESSIVSKVSKDCLDQGSNPSVSINGRGRS